MKTGYKYFAFISYNREDKEWAEWFQRELEGYHLPSTINGISDIPNSFRPVFRDVTELEAGDLPGQIEEALECSLNLVVVCSPRSAQSEWVNKEIKAFIDFGEKNGVDNINRIFPFIIEGEPYSKDGKIRCFPEELINLKGIGRERIGGDVKEESREKAFVKVLAGMLPKAVTFNMLWDRYERDKIEKERKEREQRDKLLISQSRFLAEKSTQCLADGDAYMAQMLALEALPKDINDPNERPYVQEAGKALRECFGINSCRLRGPHSTTQLLTVSRDKKLVAATSNDKNIYIWNVQNGSLLKVIPGLSMSTASCISFTNDSKHLLVGFMGIDLIVGDGRIAYISIDKQSEPDFFTPEASLRGTTGITVLPNELIAVSCRFNNRVHVVDLKTKKTVLSTHEYKKELFGLSYSEKGNVIAGYNFKGIWVYDVTDGTLITKSDFGGNKCLFTEDGEYILSISNVTSEIVKWQYRTNEIQKVSYEGHIYDISISDNGNEIACSFNNRIDVLSLLSLKTTYSVECKGATSIRFLDCNFIVATIPTENSLKIIPLKSLSINRDTTLLLGHTSRVSDMAISPDEKMLVTVSGDTTAKVWNLDEYKEIMTIDSLTPSMSYKYANFSPDGNMFYLASTDGTISIFKVKTLELIACVNDYEGYTIDKYPNVSFSTDSTLLIFENKNECLSIYNILQDETKEVDAPARIIESSLDGSFYVTSDGRNLYIIDSQNYTIRHKLIGHKQLISHIDISNDGKLLVSGSFDRTVKVWNTETGSCIDSLSQQTAEVDYVAFLDEYRKIIVSSEDWNVRIWDIENKATMELPYLRMGRFSKFAICNKRECFAAYDHDHNIHIYSFNSGEELDCYKDHQGLVNDVFISETGTVISISEDCFVSVMNNYTIAELISRTRQKLGNRVLTDEEKITYFIE